MRKIIICLFVMGIAVVMAALTITSVAVSAQNANSSTTMTESKPKPKRPKPAAPVSKCDPMKHEQADLSGTYDGTIDYPEAGLSGDATLTVTGNTFTLTAGSTTQSGRITAVTTCGYTGATMMFGDLTPPTPSAHPPAALPAVSLQAKRSGNTVTVTSVPGEKRSFKFVHQAKPTPKKGRRAAAPPAPPNP